MDSENRNLGRQVFGKPENIGNILDLESINSLICEWVPNEKLRLHIYQVGNLMKKWAQKLLLPEVDVKKWEMAGLLHDADWEKWPELHCRKIVEYLEEKNIDPEVIHAIASHSPSFFGVEPVSDMDKMIYAFDELSGFVHACSLVRPEGYTGMKVSSVMKKLKDKSFAAQVSREEIEDSSKGCSVGLDELISFVIENQANVTLPDTQK